MARAHALLGPARNLGRSRLRVEFSRIKPKYFNPQKVCPEILEPQSSAGLVPTFTGILSGWRLLVSMFQTFQIVQYINVLCLKFLSIFFNILFYLALSQKARASACRPGPTRSLRLLLLRLPRRYVLQRNRLVRSRLLPLCLGGHLRRLVGPVFLPKLGRCLTDSPLSKTDNLLLGLPL
jgi:hypothetical protein